MTPAALATLKIIGKQLDNDVYPAVYNGGFVEPCETGVSKTKGEVNHYERERAGRSETRTRKGTTGRQGPPGETSPLICTELQTHYEAEVAAVHEAYPKTLVWRQPEGLLLLTESALLQDLEQAARFIVAISYAKGSVARGWGFWGVSGIWIEWIGPRHTNFPDGSICAFEPSDGTWMLGDSLVALLDLYSVWALRHLHMKTFGRWPGHQAIQFPYERILELRPDEHCGCQHSNRLYGECCQRKDAARNTITDAVSFTLRCHAGIRKPPSKISDFALTRSNPPRISDLFHFH